MPREADEREETSDDLVGQTIGRYRITRLIGAGGMGRVYEAVVSSLGKSVAVKILSQDLAKNREASQRFEREARAASRVESPHIVDVFDTGTTDDGRPYLVMELLRGASMATTLERQGAFAPDEAVRLASQLLRGLERAHAAGVVHRDLKPDNVFLEDHHPDPAVAKILDFGVSKLTSDTGEITLTREGGVVGTPSYMSPEQAQGEKDIDGRTDLWSVGTILYQCIANKLPFPGSTYEQIIVRICSSQPVSLATLAPSCPPSLVAVVERCMERDRERRFQSASEVLEALGQASSVATPTSNPSELAPSGPRVPRARDSETIGSSSTIEAPEPQAPPKRDVRSLAIAAVLATLGLGGGWWALSSSARAPSSGAPTGAPTEASISTSPTPRATSETTVITPSSAAAASPPPPTASVVDSVSGPDGTSASPITKPSTTSRPHANTLAPRASTETPPTSASARTPGIAGDLPLQTH